MTVSGEGIVCPACGSANVGVKDTRPFPGGIRRRRLCECGTRFSTMEMPVEDTMDNQKRTLILGALDLLAKVKQLPRAKQDLVLSLVEMFVADIEPEEGR
jgi:transcriptional regulator NrdR family protein